MNFTETEMRERFRKYGTLYTSDNIRESLDSLKGLDDKKALMEEFFMALKKYGEISEMLQQVNLIPSFTMLLYGPPGTGKTSLTRAMAKKYNIPVGIVEADKLVSSLLGDTVKNIRNVFELAADFAKNNGIFILFFDEIDAIASERSNTQEVGEIKRAVISFLQILDKISYEGIPLAIFAATNHQDQLDSAVWRRFTYHLEFTFPSYEVRKEIIEDFLKKLEATPLKVEPKFKQTLEEEFRILKRYYNEFKEENKREPTSKEMDELFEKLYNTGNAGILYYTQGYTGSDLTRANRVVLFKVLQKFMLELDDYLDALQYVGGTEKHVLHNRETFGNNKKKKEKQKKQKTEKSTKKKSSKFSLNDLTI